MGAKVRDWQGVRAFAETDPRIVNCQPSGRWPALHQAIYNKHAETVAFLVAHKADPLLKNRDGKTAVDLAAGKPDLLATLTGTTYAAPPAASPYVHVPSLPAEAVQHKFLDYAKVYDWTNVKLEVEKSPGVVNAAPLGRWSALHQAAAQGNKEMVEWLISHGASTTLTNKDGKVAKDVAQVTVKDML